MKKTFTKFLFGSLFCLSLSANAQTDANLYPSNLNGGFDSYNDNTKIISGIYFQSLSDGTNSTLSTNPFKIKLYLLLTGSNTPIYIKTIDVPNGQKHLTAVDYENIDVDISAVAGLATGNYKVGVHIDADDDVIEPGKGNDDNAVSFGNINFTAGAVKQADLQVGTVTFTFDEAFSEVTDISVQIKNTGEANAAASKIKVRVEQVSNPTGSFSESSQSIGAVSAGGSITINAADIDLLGAPLESEKFRMIVTVDPDNTITESNESNNAKTVTEDISAVAGVINGSVDVAALDNMVIYDMKGNTVSELNKNQITSNGYNEAIKNLEGLYILKMTKGESFSTKKVLLAK